MKTCCRIQPWMLGFTYFIHNANPEYMNLCVNGIIKMMEQYDSW